MKKLILILCLTAASVFGADVIPTARRVPWEAGVTIGVPGGIPTDRPTSGLIDVTGAPYNADPTGVVDATATITAAIAASTTGVYIPPGTYRISSGLNPTSNKTIRGAGPTLTTLMLYTSNNLAISIAAPNAPTPSQGNPWEWPAVAITGSPVKGATTLTVADTSNITAREGKMLMISLLNDNTQAVMSVAGYERRRMQIVKIVDIPDSTHIEIFPELAFDLPTALAPIYCVANDNTIGAVNSQIEFAGVEDLLVDGTNSTTPSSLANFYCAFGCWFKNVNVKNATNYLMGGFASLQCEIRHCKIYNDPAQFGSNHGGFLAGTISGFLIEDNIFTGVPPASEINEGSTGNVIAYNYTDEAIFFGTTIGAAHNANHGPHNSYNLYEGNIACKWQSDGYFGTASNETLFRNWFHGTSATGNNSHWPIIVNRGVYNTNIVGNISGRTGFGLTWGYSNQGINFNSSSTTSVALADTDYDDVVTLTIEAGKGFEFGLTAVIVYSTGTPSRWFTGQALNYIGTSLEVWVKRSEGTGTHNDWTVVGVGGYGTPLCFALGGPNIGSGGHAGDFLGAAWSLGYWWRCWDGTQMNRPGSGLVHSTPTPYNAASVYTKGDVVDHNAAGPFPLTGPDNCLQFFAMNSAKNGTATWDEPGPASLDWTPLSSNSFQEYDASVGLTAIQRGNFNTSTLSVPSNEAMGADTYPNSYYRTTKPAFFGSIDWPSIDPTNPPADQTTNLIAFGNIHPAAWRYLKNNEDYLAGTNTLTVTATTTVTGTLTLPP